MDWLAFTSSFVGVILGILVYDSFIEPRVKAKFEQPFNWTCPQKGCTFSVEASHQHLLETVRRTHNDYQHPEGSGQDTHYVWSCGYCAFRVHADTSTDLDNAIGNHQFHRHGK